MYPAIRSFDEWQIPSQDMVEVVKKHGGFRPQRGYTPDFTRLQTPDPIKFTRKRLKTLDSDVAEDFVMKDIIK